MVRDFKDGEACVAPYFFLCGTYGLMHGIALASGKGGGSESAERSETDATKEHPKGEREGWRERVSRAERDRCDEGAPEGRAGRVAGASQ